MSKKMNKKGKSKGTGYRVDFTQWETFMPVIIFAAAAAIAAFASGILFAD